MIEAHGLDERDVAGCGPVFEVLFGVSLGIVNLGKPLVEINAVSKMARTALKSDELVWAKAENEKKTASIRTVLRMRINGCSSGV